MIMLPYDNVVVRKILDGHIFVNEVIFVVLKCNAKRLGQGKNNRILGWTGYFEQIIFSISLLTICSFAAYFFILSILISCYFFPVHCAQHYMLRTTVIFALTFFHLSS